MKFYVCEICGNIIAYVEESGVNVVCCGEEMKELVPNTTDAATEKHVPVITVDGSTVTVDFTGVAPRAVHIAVEERAAVVPALDGPADTTLTVDLVEYARLIGARPTADPSKVAVTGDERLGEKIVASLHYLI